MKTLLSPRFLAVLVALLLVLSLIPTSNGPALEAVLAKAGLEKVGEAAEAYLKEQRDQALKGFLLLSALKVGLAVLKSSEVGFILNVKVGDLAVAVYDYVDFGWRILLAAVAYYYIAEYLMDLASVVNIWFLWVALVSILAWLLVLDLRPGSRGWRTASARTAVAGGVFAILLYAVLPLSFLAAGWVSAHITGEPIHAANRFYEDMGKSMPSLVDDTSRTDSKAAGSSIGTSSVTVPVPYHGADPAEVITERSGDGRENLLAGIISGEKLRELKEYLQQRSKALASAVLRQTAAYLFNIVVFPLLTLLVTWWCIRYLSSLVADIQKMRR